MLFLSIGYLGMHLFGQISPTLNDRAYLNPGGQNWVLVDILSDEFNDSPFLDEGKWQTSPKTYSGWKGRIPGIFAREAISVSKGNLQISASLLLDSVPVTQKGVQRYWTHQGGLVRSQSTAQVGDYVECRMKANQTFMSSTFWVINEPKQAGTGCDRRVTELDITECVGAITTTASWAQDKFKAMSSNTHDRRPAKQGCTPNASSGNEAVFPQGTVYDDFHVYGAWWKSPQEVLFFLDGEWQYTITPPSDFNLPMHIMMVVETYDWNPPMPGADGMSKSEEERTTYYDWVRTWRLGGTTNIVDATSLQTPIKISSRRGNQIIKLVLERKLTNGTVQILDEGGKVVFRQNHLTARKGNLKLNLGAGLPPGLYLLLVEDKQLSLHTELLINE